MAATYPNYLDEHAGAHSFDSENANYRRASASAVSWGAIVAGAAAAAALALILLILGMGLGLSSVSPWYHEGITATTFGTSTIVWLSVTQLLASAMGGYLAGRLRTKWIEVHTDEVYFRDTAHGFLSWAVASLVTAGLLTSVIGSILSGGMHASAALAGGTARATAVVATHGIRDGNNAGGTDGGALAYFADTLFRRDSPAPVSTSPEDTMPVTLPARASRRDVGEVTRIFRQVGNAESLPAEDQRYLAQMVAQHTGLSQQDAERRVTDTYARLHTTLRDAEEATKQIADAARKASAHGALWLFISLLVGAFVASLSATIGGRRRDA